MQKRDKEIIDGSYKIIMLGDVFVGKTCILSRLIENYFRQNSLNTIGVDFVKKVIEVNNKQIKL